MVYVKEDIPCCQLTNHPPVHNLLDIIATELKFRKQTWLLIVVYKSASVSDTDLPEQMSNVIDFYLQKYQNIVLAGDFNIDSADKSLMHSVRATSIITLLRVKHVSNQVVVHV